MESVFCPRCETESKAVMSYCRKCGTDLQASLLPQHGEGIQPENARMRALRTEIMWEAVRGGVTLVIAIPFFLFMAMVAARTGGAVTAITLLILLVFIGLGIRDLRRAYTKLRNPAAALAESAERQNAMPTSQFVQPASIARDSVTAQTTFPLDKEADTSHTTVTRSTN